MPVTRIRTPRVYQQIAQQIEGLIHDGEYKPGARLPSEREFSQMFGVSRPSVREAMIALEAAGLVEVRSGNGTYVRTNIDSQIHVSPAEGKDLGPGPLEQFEARMLVEPGLAKLAAQRITKEELAQLEHLITRMGESSYLEGTFKEGDSLGREFHVTLAKASRNTVLANLVAALWEMRGSDMWATLRQRVVRPVHRAQAYADRREIVTALRRRDGDMAEEMMIALLEKARARYFDG